MSKDDFEKYLNNKIDESTTIKIDWGKQLLEWKDYLNQFYSQINSFLHVYVDSRKIKIEKHKMQIDEEYLGRYEVETDKIIIGRDEIRLEPIGTNLIAAKGRVDMKGPNGVVRFVLVDSNARSMRDHIKIEIVESDQVKEKEKTEVVKTVNWAWRIVTNPPTGKYLEFNQENFLSALLEVTNA